MLSSQSPFDPASGAARADRAVCELLVEAGFGVRAISTTASEHEKPDEPLGIVRRFGIEPRIEKPPGGAEVWRFEHRGVLHTMLNVGVSNPVAWLGRHHSQHLGLVRGAMAERPARIVFGYGGRPEERERRAACRERGARSVMYLHNWAYMDARAFEDIDHVMACSKEIARRYLEQTGVVSTPMPMPIDEEELRMEKRDPRYVTFVNPSAEKGVVVAARICEDICARRADIPFLIVNARKTAATLIKAGFNGGFDLRRHQQIVFSPGLPTAGPIFAATKLLLVPSVWDEPGARIVAESMFLGIPAVISDRGGMKDTANGGAVVLPIPKHVNSDWLYPLTSEEAQPWVEAIEYLWDDRRAYNEQCWRASASGAIFKRENLRRAFAEYFDGVGRA